MPLLLLGVDLTPVIPGVAAKAPLGWKRPSTKSAIASRNITERRRFYDDCTWVRHV